MIKILQVSVSELSLKTARSIENKIDELSSKYRIKSDTEDKMALWGGKVVTVLNGDEENISLVTKLLKQDFKVKEL